MHYWNKVNFEGLSSLGDACANVANLKFFAQYCHLREKGHRKQALEAATSFAKFVSELESEAQQEISTRLIELQCANPGIHQLLPHPIKVALIDISKTWATSTSSNATPLVHLGHLTGDIEYFESAIRIRPNDQVALKKLARYHLDSVDYQQHHLSESRFIGSVDEAHVSLRHAEEFIDQLEEAALRKSLKDELEQLALVLSEWTTYCEDQTAESFPQWTGKRGHSFGFPSIVYYSRT